MSRIMNVINKQMMDNVPQVILVMSSPMLRPYIKEKVNGFFIS